MSLEEVYRKATAWVIKDSGCLGMICLLEPDRMEVAASHWPPWVPDYRSPPPTLLRLFDTEIGEQSRLRATSDDDLRPRIQEKELHVHAQYMGTVSDIGDTYSSMIVHGCFELNARVLLNCPRIMPNGVDRLDAWRKLFSRDEDPSAIEDPPSTDSSYTPSDHPSSRASFKNWFIFYIIRAVRQAYYEGRIKSFREHLAKMPMFELLAECEDGDHKMLPDLGFWQKSFNEPTSLARITGHRPRFRTVEISGRRLFRMKSPICLGIGPEGMLEGDEVWCAATATLPLVLRKVEIPTDCEDAAPGTYVVVGEAYFRDVDKVANTIPGEE